MLWGWNDSKVSKDGREWSQNTGVSLDHCLRPSNKQQKEDQKENPIFLHRSEAPRPYVSIQAPLLPPVLPPPFHWPSWCLMFSCSHLAEFIGLPKHSKSFAYSPYLWFSVSISPVSLLSNHYFSLLWTHFTTCCPPFCPLAGHSCLHTRPIVHRLAWWYSRSVKDLPMILKGHKFCSSSSLTVHIPGIEAEAEKSQTEVPIL